MKKYKYTKEILEPIVKGSQSMREVLNKLGLQYTGGNYASIKKAIKREQIESSHLTGRAGQGWRKGKIIGFSYPLEDYLTNKRYMSSDQLKKRLIKENIFKNECQHCKQTMWFDLPIPLELHHIDHNHENNNLSNLMILCSNCHSYIHKSNTIQSKIEKQKATKKREHIRKSEPKPRQRKVERPDYKTLQREIAETNYSAVGRKYGVSDNAVRKWIKTYESTGDRT